MHPLLFQTKFLSINTFWIFIVIAVIATTYTVIQLSIKNSLKLQFLSDNSFTLFIYALIGARLVSVIQNYQTFFYEFSSEALIRILYIWDKGLNPWGGAITFLIAFYYICKKNDQDFFKWIDVIVPSILIGMAITHIGAFFEGINYGRETALPWGVNFESPSIKYTVPIHPTQIYATIYTGIIAIGLLYLYKAKKFTELKKEGLIALLGVFAYNLMRFFEEFVRGDDTWLIWSIRVPQIIALIITITTGVYIYKRHKKDFKFKWKFKSKFRAKLKKK